MAALKDVWAQVVPLLKQGFSLIPVRDKQETYNGKVYEPKTPCIKSWKQFQERIITEAELWAAMENSGTSAIAIIAGRVSGNLEVIDIDQKHWPGIGMEVFRLLHDIYPNIFRCLRIHSTPSGGYHIIYRIADGVPEGNQKLAYHAEHKECGIETRGEGGYICAPPCIGYSVFQDVPVPVITMEQRDIIINTCRSFNQKIKVQKHKSETKEKDSYYDENPFEHFNRSTEAGNILPLHGWKYDGTSGPWVHYTRPGKGNGVSASFNSEKQYYYFFTTSTEFEARKGYSPSSVRAMLECNGDYKVLHRKLVSEGYGRVNPSVQQRIAHRNALSATPLPANFDVSTLADYEQLIQDNAVKYPYGIFWHDDEGKIVMEHERMIIVATGLGYRLYNGKLCQIDEYKVHFRKARHLLDEIKAYVKEEDADYYMKVLNAYEAFMKHNYNWIIDRVPEIDRSAFMLSSKDKSYKFFTNAFVEITKDNITAHPYSLVSGLVWADTIRQRDVHFIAPADYNRSFYFDFIYNAIGWSDHILNVIGYLAHEYKDEDSSYIIVLTEAVPDPAQGGGSGKNIFTSMFGQTTSYVSIPGEQVQYNEKFLQVWDYQKIFAISDLPRDFKFEFLKELSSGTGNLKKLFKDEQTVDVEDMPKFVLSTNFSYKITDGGLRRRIIPVEFSNYFTLSGGVRKKYGVMFPKGFDAFQMAAFDNIMFNCIQSYLQAGELFNPGLSAGGWQKQFDIEFNQDTREYIETNIDNWLRVEFIDNITFQREYETFLVNNGVQLKYKLSNRRLNDALKSYCNAHYVAFDPNFLKSISGLKLKGKRFYKV